MIVSDDNIHDALAYLAIDPHPIALAKKDLTDAENEKEKTYAEVYGGQSGSIRDKEMATDADSRIVECRVRISEMALALERHKARVRAAEMLIEVWRSENANARAAERIR